MVNLWRGQRPSINNLLTSEVSTAKHQKRVIPLVSSITVIVCNRHYILRFVARGKLDMVWNGYNRCFDLFLRCKFAVSESYAFLKGEPRPHWLYTARVNGTPCITKLNLILYTGLGEVTEPELVPRT